jgi:hypothetical protein
VYKHTAKEGGAMDRSAENGAPATQAEKRQAESSEVVEYRPYEDGFLQAEMRIYTRKDGSRTSRGLYWYHRYHEGGKQKKLYLGKTSDPEGKLAEKRGASSP